MKAKKDKILTASVAAVLSVSMLTAAGNAVNSVLAMMSSYFPEASQASIRLVSTLPSIVNVIVGLLMGKVIGKKIRYKTTFVLGGILFVLGGMGPAFFHGTLSTILMFRLIFGCGIGCLTFSNAWFLETQPLENHARILGMAAFMANAGAAVLQMASGPLADRKWYYAFYPYMIGLGTLVMVLTLMKDTRQGSVAGMTAVKDTDEALNIRTSEDQKKERVSPEIMKYVLINFFVSLTAMPVMSGMSMVVAGRGIGGQTVATTVSVILTVCQVGGILVGIVFDRYVKILKRMAIPGALTIQGLGIFLILIAPNVFVVGLGATVSGIGTILISSLCTMYVGESTPKSTIPMATVIVLMMSQAGIFLSSYYIQICERITGARFGTDAESSYAVSSVLYVAVIIAAIAMILAGSKRSKQDAPVNE